MNGCPLTQQGEPILVWLVNRMLVKGAHTLAGNQASSTLVILARRLLPRGPTDRDAKILGRSTKKSRLGIPRRD